MDVGGTLYESQFKLLCGKFKLPLYSFPFLCAKTFVLLNPRGVYTAEQRHAVNLRCHFNKTATATSASDCLLCLFNFPL